MLNKLKPYFYLLLLFVLTGGMFDDLFNIIFTLLLFPFIIISPIFVLKKVKSKFIIVILMLGLFVALISMLQSGMVSLEGRLFGGSAIDNSFVFTIKTLVKIIWQAITAISCEKQKGRFFLPKPISELLRVIWEYPGIPCIF